MGTDKHSRWLDILAGRDVADADPKLRDEAQKFREVLLRRRANEPTAVNVEDQVARFHRYLATQRKPEREQGWLDWLRQTLAKVSGPRFAVAAVLVLGIGLAIRVMLPPDIGTDKGVGAGRVYISTPDPLLSQSGLASELRELGVEVRVLSEPSGEAMVVQAALPPQIEPRVADVLQRYGLSRFKGGDLDIGFRKP